MELGVWNTLKVERSMPQGLYLTDDSGEEVLLPNKYCTPEMEIESKVNVFVYRDSEDRLVATTETPLAIKHTFAYLKVTSVNTIGAFLHWGLEKDLLVPFKEQRKRMEEGFSYPVYIYEDEMTGRLVATNKYERFLSKEFPEYSPMQEVQIFITHLTDLGVNVIIENQHKGLIYHNEVFTFLSLGDTTSAYIKEILPNGNITVTLRKQGKDLLDAGAQRILDRLHEKNGFLELTDNSSPEEIMFQLQMSKKNFKKSVGILYKQGKVILHTDGIRLT